MTTTESELFDTAPFDLPGTPKLNGVKATSIVMALDTFEFNRQRRGDMELVGKLQELGPGETLNITIQVSKSADGFTRPLEGDLGYRVKVKIQDVAAT